MTELLHDTDNADVDYITILPTVDMRQCLVAIYKHVGNGEYVQTKVSGRLDKVAAERVAGAWSAALGLTIKL